jgi:SAM-dependent methyltransferase
VSNLQSDRAQLRQLMDVVLPQAIAVVNHLGVADVLGDTTLPITELSSAVDADATTLYRLMRYVAQYGVFTETKPQWFANTALSEGLRADAPQSVRWRVEGDTLVQPWLAWDQWLATAQTGEPAYDRQHGRSYWDALASDPQAGAVADEDQRQFALRWADETLAAVDLSDADVVVDVGGGVGTWLLAMLKRAPDVRGILFERPSVGERAARHLQAEDEAVASRCRVVAGDFFVDPLPSADIYVLCNVLHDWNDEQAARILATCVSAMKPTSRILVLDRIVADGDRPDHAKAVDLNMLFLVGGRERNAAEFNELAASVGLRVVNTTPTSSPLAVIELGPSYRA